VFFNRIENTTINIRSRSGKTNKNRNKAKRQLWGAGSGGETREGTREKGCGVRARGPLGRQREEEDAFTKFEL
jgi:hypothetical protein